MRVKPRTVREFFEEEDPDTGPGLVHLVRGTGLEDTELAYYTRCNAMLFSNGPFSVQREIPTCLVCVSETKRCLHCNGTVDPARFPWHIAERCEECAL